MIGRGVWFVAGAAAGVYGTVRARRAAESFTAEGMRHRMKAASLGARLLREEVAQGKAEAEVELRERYEVAADKQRALEAPHDGLDTPPLGGLDTPARSSRATRPKPREGYSTTDEQPSPTPEEDTD